VKAAERRLVALAAAIAPARAGRLLRLISGASAAEAARLGSLLAMKPRGARLAALAAELPAHRTGDATPSSHGILARLAREASASPSASH
jgi:hypothetical protein